MIDKFLLFGLFIGLGAIVTGNIVEGGSTGHLIQLGAAFIVFGGTAGAVLVSFPAYDLKLGLKGLKIALLDRKIKNEERLLIEEIIGLLVIARKKGLLAVEKELSSIENRFLRENMRMVVDGYEVSVIRDVVLKKIKNFEDEVKTASKVFESAGGYAPTIGIIGAVLGLIHVLQNITEPSKIGTGIAIAFVATIYGVGSANLIFIPLAKRIIQKAKREIRKNLLVLKGIEGIEKGVNPAYLRDILESIRENQL
ncbi:flagellar motor protein [Thermodesulfovibrio sp.]|uniref:flagellar motor protein n=1 Tax=Thermodesulfovibrio sp. TaxID=2067987 RepID=UPI0030994DB6